MHSLQKLLSELDLEPFAYSGRDMYGKTCLGVTGAVRLGIFISTMLAQQNEDFNSLDIEESDWYSQFQTFSENWKEISYAFAFMRTDTMGKNIIFYFPDVKFETNG